MEDFRRGEVLWGEVRGRIRGEISEAAFNTWLKDSKCLGFEKGVLRVGVRNAFVREWIEKRLLSRLERVLAEVAQSHGLGRIKLAIELSSSVPEEYTFKEFIVGRGNILAYRAAIEVVEHPGKLNPLFIYSAPGLGKTHLLRAITYAVRENHLNPIYINAHRFIEEFIFSIRNSLGYYFQERFRKSDILLFDDFHLLCGKTKTLNSFLCIFKELIEDKRQVVISSLFPPQELSLPSSLYSMLLSGVILPIYSPDKETRLNFLKARAERLQLRLSDELLNQLADKEAENFQILIGYLNQIMAGDYLDKMPTFSGDRLMLRAVARYFMLSEEELLGKSRRPQVSLARAILVYLLRKELNFTFPQIAKRLNLSKSSTIYCFKKISMELEDPSMQKALSRIKELAKEPTSQP